MQRLRALIPATLVFSAALFQLASMSTRAATSQNEFLSYIGTYTGAKSKGIYVSRFDARKGKLTPPELAAETKNPSFLAVHPNGRWLYGAGEVDSFEGKPQGVITAFRMAEPTGRLEMMNQQPSGGAGPCYLALDSTGKCLLVANYNSGTVAAFPVGSDGRLGPLSVSIQHQGSSVNRERQAGPHAHFITPDPGNHFALTCDLGLDKVLVYRLDPVTASLTANDPPAVSLKPGSGPRHLAFHPNGRLVYVINEMGSSISAFSYEERTGRLKELETRSTLPPDFKGQNTCAEIQVHPSGRFLYGSNRGHDSIALFSINPKDGRLQRTACVSAGGRTPRHFTLDPSGKWLLVENQDSDNVVIFAVDPKTGNLTPTGDSIKVGAPVCLVFVK